MRTAHIVTTPHEVGDKVLALCGKEHKVKTAWADIPDDNPICRDCVDTVLAAATEADDVITKARTRLGMISRAAVMLTDTLNPEGGLDLDEIAQAADEYTLIRQARKKAKSTCTCAWTTQDNFEVDPDCPIHGGPPPVAPPLEG